MFKGVIHMQVICDPENDPRTRFPGQNLAGNTVLEIKWHRKWPNCLGSSDKWWKTYRHIMLKGGNTHAGQLRPTKWPNNPVSGPKSPICFWFTDKHVMVKRVTPFQVNWGPQNSPTTRFSGPKSSPKYPPSRQSYLSRGDLFNLIHSFPSALCVHLSADPKQFVWFYMPF